MPPRTKKLLFDLVILMIIFYYIISKNIQSIWFRVPCGTINHPSVVTHAEMLSTMNKKKTLHLSVGCTLHACIKQFTVKAKTGTSKYDNKDHIIYAHVMVRDWEDYVH